MENKLMALKEILAGNGTEATYAVLDDDWTIEERTHEALRHWQLTGLNLLQNLEGLSGGQKTKLFLAGISIHQPELVCWTSRVTIWMMPAGSYCTALFNQPRVRW